MTGDRDSIKHGDRQMKVCPYEDLKVKATQKMLRQDGIRWEIKIRVEKE